MRHIDPETLQKLKKLDAKFGVSISVFSRETNIRVIRFLFPFSTHTLQLGLTTPQFSEVSNFTAPSSK